MIDIPERFRAKKPLNIPKRYRRKPTVSADLDSKAIDSIVYKGTDLYLTFARDGSQYIYHDVPKDEVDGLINAESPGAYFNDNIRDVYDYE